MHRSPTRGESPEVLFNHRQQQSPYGVMCGRVYVRGMLSAGHQHWIWPIVSRWVEWGRPLCNGNRALSPHVVAEEDGIAGELVGEGL